MEWDGSSSKNNHEILNLIKMNVSVCTYVQLTIEYPARIPCVADGIHI